MKDVFWLFWISQREDCDDGQASCRRKEANEDLVWLQTYLILRPTEAFILVKSPALGTFKEQAIISCDADILQDQQRLPASSYWDQISLVFKQLFNSVSWLIGRRKFVHDAQEVSERSGMHYKFFAATLKLCIMTLTIHMANVFRSLRMQLLEAISLWCWATISHWLDTT